MQTRLLEVISVEQLKSYYEIAEKLSESFSEEDKRELLRLSDDPSLPNSHSDNPNYSEYYRILSRGFAENATEEEKHLAQINRAALAIQLFSEVEDVLHDDKVDVKDAKEKIKSALFNREQKELDLSNLYRLWDPHAIYLTYILPLTAVTSLNLHLSLIGVEGVKALAANTTLTHLDVSRNHFGPKGAKALATNKTLVVLNVYDCDIGDVGAAALASNTTLRDLDVGSNEITYVGAESLSANTTLNRLNVVNNSIGIKGAKAFADNTTLSYLDASSNHFGPDGAKEIARNTTLTDLQLRCNQIGDEGAIALAANTTLMILNVKSNRIGDKGAKALSTNTTLDKLEVIDKKSNIPFLEKENNIFSDVGIMALAEKNPVKRFNAAKEAGVETDFPSLKRQTAFFIQAHPNEKLQSGETLKEKSDKISDVKDELGKPKV